MRTTPSFLTMTCCLAIRFVPTAMVSVNTEMRDSGIMATPQAMAYSATSSERWNFATEKTMITRRKAETKRKYAS